VLGRIRGTGPECNRMERGLSPAAARANARAGWIVFYEPVSANGAAASWDNSRSGERTDTVFLCTCGNRRLDFRSAAFDPHRSNNYETLSKSFLLQPAPPRWRACPRNCNCKFLGEFRGLPQQALGTELDAFGKLELDGRTLHRFRVGDYRVYFERHELGVLVHRILSRHTLKDFLFRSGLKTGEDEALQENPKFWELIESAKTSAKT